MKFLFTVFTLLVLCNCKPNKIVPGHSVKIVLDTEEPLAELDTIYLTGNVPVLGNWNPKGLAMKRRSESRWEQTFEAADSTNLEFKFCLGDMDHEAVSNIGVIPGNSKMEINKNTEVYFVIEDWKHLQKEPIKQ